MTCIQSVTLEVPDLQAANAFYAAAFGLDAQVGLRPSGAPTSGAGDPTGSLMGTRRKPSRPARYDMTCKASGGFDEP